MKITSSTPFLLSQVVLIAQQAAALPRPDSHWPDIWHNWNGASISISLHGEFTMSPQHPDQPPPSTQQQQQPTIAAAATTTTTQETISPTSTFENAVTLTSTETTLTIVTVATTTSESSTPSSTSTTSTSPLSTSSTSTSSTSTSTTSTPSSTSSTSSTETSTIQSTTTSSTETTTSTTETTTSSTTTTAETVTSSAETTASASTAENTTTDSTSTSTAASVEYTPDLTGPGGFTAYPSVRSNNTLNSTVAPDSTESQPLPIGQLQISLVNNYNTDAALNAYITGLDSTGRLVMLQPNGEFYYPQTNSTVPIAVDSSIVIPLGAQGSTTNIIIPSWISAARVWVSQGTLQFFTVKSGDALWSLVEPSVVSPSDPNIDVDFGFVELTNDATLGLYINISYVDFVGLAVGIAVTTTTWSNSTKTYTTHTQSVSGVSQGAAEDICGQLQAQEAIDGYPWGDLCVTDSSTDALVRVLSPANHITINETAFSDYWDTYLDAVWDKYSSEALVINTQASAGNVSCKVSGDVFVCDGSSRTYAKPSAADIFSCNSGPFVVAGTDNDVHRAIVPRLCAAINRSTLLLDGGNVQPALMDGSYYSVSPTNHYSRIVHEHSAGGIGYAFSYDDVMPDGGVNESGLIAVSDPAALEVAVQD